MMLKPSQDSLFFISDPISYFSRGGKALVRGWNREREREREKTSRNDILISLILKLSKASSLYDREQHHTQSGK